ncbi:hypothetical protein BHS06_29505 [Myxococcus xanthus]|nr:hypothetical protein BHS06_29505 [Myxococcus xanthus]
MAAFAEMGMGLYAEAWDGPDVDPLEKLHRLLDVMSDPARQRGGMLTCRVGMLSQALALSNATVRQAKRLHPPRVGFDPDAVAWMGSSSRR